MNSNLSNELLSLSQDELDLISGGYTGWRGGLCSFVGGLGIACSIPVWFANPAAGAILMGTGMSIMDCDDN